MNRNFKFNNHNLYLVLIYFFWAISILFYFLFNEYIKAGNLEDGVKLGNDSRFYLRESKNILNGWSSIFDYKSKFGYLLFLIPFLYFELPLIYVVLLQFLLTFIGSYCLYKITTKYFGKKSAIICLSLFLFYLPIQIRNFYILTEILFIDLSLILTFFIVFYKKQYIPVIIFLLAFLISIRPNGMLFLFSLMLCILFFLINHAKKNYIILFLAILLIMIFPTYYLINAYFENLNFIDSLNRGIIWGWSFENNQICKTSCLSNELINKNYQNSLLGYSQFVIANYYEYFKIFFFKIFWLIARARPYYSDLHNYYIIFFNLIFYLGFIYGLAKRPKNNFSIKFIIFFILFSMILAGLTFADWSGRFSLYFLPFIMIFSSYGILIFIKKILKMIN
jgi:hypothetical protein